MILLGIKFVRDITENFVVITFQGISAVARIRIYRVIKIIPTQVTMFVWVHMQHTLLSRFCGWH